MAGALLVDGSKVKPSGVSGTLLVAALIVMHAAHALQGEQASPRPRSPDELVIAFRDAFTQASADKALALFYWRGVSEQQRAGVVGFIERDRSLRLERVTLLPLGAGPTVFESETQRFEPNLPLVGHLLAEFVDARGQSRYSLHMIGVSAGVYYIALAVPPEA